MYALPRCLGGPFDGHELRRLDEHNLTEGPFAGALFLWAEDDSACFVIGRVVHVYSLQRERGTLRYVGSFRDENGRPVVDPPRRPR